MKYEIKPVLCGLYQENAYLLCPEGTKDALLIDPGDDLNALKRALEASGRTLRAILLTHGHFDHMLAAQPLSRITGAPVYVHPLDQELLCDEDKNAYDPGCASLPCPADFEAEDLEDEIEVCGLRFRVLHTPGHTRGSVCYYDEENGILFSGDTLFCAGFGRMDLYGGSPAQMRTALRSLFELPEDTQVYCGHGPMTSIQAEKRRYSL